MAVNNPWSALGLAPGADKRAIKRAYAALLKRARPDDNPEAFQALHAAYKRALSLAENPTANHRPPAEQPVQPVEPLSEERQNLLAELRAADLRRRQAEQEALQAAEAARLTTLKELTGKAGQQLASAAGRKDGSGWGFLARSGYLMEPEFNRWLGLGVATELGPYLHRASREFVHDALLSYLNNLFDWSGQRHFYFQNLETAFAERLFKRLDSVTHAEPVISNQWTKQNKRIEQKEVPRRPEYLLGGILGRTFACIIDLFLAYLIALAILWLFDDKNDVVAFKAVIFSVPTYLLFAWLLESSEYMATPGKRLMGYRVATRRLKRMGYIQGLWRLLCFILNLSLFKFTFIVNALCKGNLVHDRLSFSLVVDLHLSEDEQTLGWFQQHAGGWLWRRKKKNH